MPWYLVLYASQNVRRHLWPEQLGTDDSRQSPQDMIKDLITPESYPSGPSGPELRGVCPQTPNHAYTTAHPGPVVQDTPPEDPNLTTDDYGTPVPIEEEGEAVPQASWTSVLGAVFQLLDVGGFRFGAWQALA